MRAQVRGCNKLYMHVCVGRGMMECDVYICFTQRTSIELENEFTSVRIRSSVFCSVIVEIIFMACRT